MAEKEIKSQVSGEGRKKSNQDMFSVFLCELPLLKAQKEDSGYQLLVLCI